MGLIFIEKRFSIWHRTIWKKIMWHYGVKLSFFDKIRCWRHFAAHFCLFLCLAGRSVQTHLGPDGTRLRNLKGGIESLFYAYVNAMGRRPYCPSRMDVSSHPGHARDFAWYRGQRPSPASWLKCRTITTHARESVADLSRNCKGFRARESVHAGVTELRTQGTGVGRDIRQSPSRVRSVFLLIYAGVIYLRIWHNVIAYMRALFKTTRERQLTFNEIA